MQDEARDKGYESGVRWVCGGERVKCPYPSGSPMYVDFYNAQYEAVEELQQEYRDGYSAVKDTKGE